MRRKLLLIGIKGQLLAIASCLRIILVHWKRNDGCQITQLYSTSSNLQCGYCHLRYGLGVRYHTLMYGLY